MRYLYRALVCLVLSLLLPATLVAQWTSTGATDSISHNGPVTIGTSTITSGYALDVAGSTRLGGNVFLGSPTLGIFTLYLWPDPSGTSIRGTGTGMDLLAQGGTIHLFNGNTAIDGWDPNPATHTALTVKGSTSSAANAALKITDVVGVPLMFVRNDGNVGIGTDVPGLRLDVYGASAVYGGARRIARLFDTTPMGIGVGGGMDFLGKYNTSYGNYTQFANIKGVKATATEGDFAGNFVISINDNGGNMQEIVRVTPTAMTVNGTLTATQVIGATFQDVAEWVPASELMRAGTVVVVDPGADNGVMPSSHAYDTGVAGVVSAQPGVILGVEGASKAMIATTGRVKVRVDARHAPIRAGDLLVTSNNPGVAMRSEPIDVNGRKFHQPGTIVGKALQPLAAGEGEILVLLSLQ
jgi:hypothetical protein